MSYLEEGYNEFLERIDFNESTDRLSSLDFDSALARHSVGTQLVGDEAITTAKIKSLVADKITTGTLGVGTVINVGETNIKIDGTGRQIIINDGTNDRVLLGFQSGGF